MSNILDSRQQKINSGVCTPLYHARMEYLADMSQYVQGHCFICSCKIGQGAFGQTKAYRNISGKNELVCVKCFNDFKDTLDLK